ncbi:hypothetical protein GEMRC1_008508 [Eukaryota sp. GEM-RC1]
MLKFLELVQNHHDILLFSTSEFQKAQVLKSMSRFSNVLFITLISIPIILTKSAKDGSTLTCGRKLGGSGSYSTPTPFAEDIEFVFITTTGTHAHGIDVNSKLWSWGVNSSGRLGTGSSSSSVNPVELKVVGKVITAAARWWHSTAVDVNNDVWSWGRDRYGALGRSTSTTSNPGRIEGLIGSDITDIVSYYYSNLAYSSTRPSGISGQGKLSIINSEVKLAVYELDLKTIYLSYSKLQLREVALNNLKSLELFDNSLVNFTRDSKIASEDLTITLNSSELYFDDSFDFSSSSVSLIAISSRFQSDFDIANFRILDLYVSTFESVSTTQTIVAYFSCFHCQILGSSAFLIETYSEINSGNFSSSLIVQESVDNSSITGQVQLANSFDFFSHVILDDVSVSEFQSSSGSIICHSDVLMKNDVGISKISFIYNGTLTLYGSTLLFDPFFVILDYQIITGFGTIITNTSNCGKIKPSSNFTFEDNIFLSSSSIVSLQINNDYSSTQLIIGSTAYLDGILELELDTKYDSTGNNYTLIEAGLINGRFSSFNPCASLITTFYSETSLIVSVNDFVVDLNQTSYISPSGNDDPCCGTFDSPCASFKGVLDRMGRKGKVYFHEGSYTFDQGLGKVNHVDWEVIGLGDLIIEGVDVPVFEIVHSNVSVSNIDIFCYSSFCFSLPDSTFQFINSSVVHDAVFSATTLSIDEINQLSFDNPQLHWGHVSFIDSNIMFFSAQMHISSMSLVSSNLQLNNFTFKNLEQVNLDSESIMSLSEDSKINSDSLHITLNSSELYYDDSVDISSSNVILIAFNSHFQNDFDFANIHILDLFFSTFESASDTHTTIAYFTCFRCQILGSSLLSIETYSDINSGNFSSSLIVQESAVNSSITGLIHLANSVDFFSHVILDDVSVSEFQSSSGSITCHSDVLMRNFVTFSTTTFNSVAGIILSDANVILNQNFELLDFQILKGLGVVFDNTSNAGQIIPLPLIIFDDNLSLFPSSTVSIQINNDNSSTQVIVGSTAFLVGTIEVEFDPFKHWGGKQYVLIDSCHRLGQFTSVKSTCSSIFNIEYTSTSVIGFFDDYIAHLNTISYISTTGVDDPCCGTFDSPCASFRGVFERMGRKGKVIFHEGSYTFNQGLGNVTDVDWQLIGVGDVIIEGIDETLFEIVHSNLSLSNIDIFAIPPIVFLYLTQPFN